MGLNSSQSYAGRIAFFQFLYIYAQMFAYIPQAHLLEKKAMSKEAPNVLAHTK